MPDRTHLEFLSGPIQFVKGVGPRRAAVLRDAGVSTVRDLLQYYPRRYLDRTSVTPIRVIESGSEPVTVVGIVRATGVVPGRRGKRFELIVEDEPARRIKCVWFRGVNWVSKAFENGQMVAFHGKPTKYGGSLTLAHPDFDILDEEAPALETGRIISLYPGGAALSSVGLSSRSFRRILFHLFKADGKQLMDVLPAWLISEYGLLEGRRAMRAVHFPRDDEELKRARHRLKFEELFYIQLMLARMKRDYQKEEGIPFERLGLLSSRFVDEVLPFELTGAQRSAIEDVVSDTASGSRMNRLLQGDVGSGKTVVAVAAMLHGVDNGCQAAFMAPTEILAEQHYRNLRVYLEPLGVDVRLLIGGMKKSERSEVIESLASGALRVVVGTHAVIQKDVTFEKLGICIVDEQHRFGVMQRATLSGKGDRPHVLLMTATPIPRSLAMTLYGDLDVSRMEEKPPGRQSIDTRVVWASKREEAYALLTAGLDAGRQAYVVYPLVDESEKLDLKDAETGLATLREKFPRATVDLVHGRMSGADKEAAMRRFVFGETQILVATTVIEVGVDVPNATIMMIEHAERFGLSQLHQLRGRVGRGEEQSLCILMAEYKRSAEADERLRTMERTDDGFRISEVDLKIRGAGDFFGTRQSGLPDLRIADLVQDTDILLEAREAAVSLTERDPDWSRPEHAALAAYFKAFYGPEKVGLSRVG